MRNKEVSVLVKKAQDGDSQALEALYNNFFNQIYNYVYSRVNDQHYAQEITSDTFLSLVEGIKKYEGKSSFKNYLFGICKNKLRDYIRNKYKSSDFILESNFAENTFDHVATEEVEDVEEAEYRNKIRKILNKIKKNMKARYAIVLDLRFNQMNSVEETAKMLNLTPNNVKVIQHRAIKQAKTIWEKMSETEKEKLL
jgi:RNA polymerase sigma-70 factor, ECF subfamily